MARQYNLDLLRLDQKVDAITRQLSILTNKVADINRYIDADLNRDDNDESSSHWVWQLEEKTRIAEMLANNYKQRLTYALHYKNQPQEFRRLVVDLFKAINGYVPGDGDR